MATPYEAEEARLGECGQQSIVFVDKTEEVTEQEPEELGVQQVVLVGGKGEEAA